MLALKTLKLPCNQQLKVSATPKSYLKCTFQESEVDCSSGLSLWVPKNVPLSLTPVREYEVVDATILAEGEGVKTTFAIKFKLNEDEDINYLPGDTIGILPENDASDVDKLIEALHLTAESNLSCTVTVKDEEEKKSVPHYIPEKSSIRFILTHCLNIRSPLTKIFITALAAYTENDTERRRMLELSSKECSLEYQELVLNSRTTLITFLTTFTSCKPPFNVLIENLPRLMPRPYSICTSQLLHKDTLSIVLNLSDSSALPVGICSGYLYRVVQHFLNSDTRLSNMTISDAQNNKKNTKVCFYFRKPTIFRYPLCDTDPMILVCNGTGLAPFIGFLEHRKALKNLYPDKKLSECWLFFGCRNKTDFIFRNELEQFQSEGVLSRVFVSHSRLDDVNGSNAKYIQDNICKYKEEFIPFMMKEDTKLYLCGDLKNIVNDFMKTTAECYQNIKGISTDETAEIICKVAESGRIICESWSWEKGSSKWNFSSNPSSPLTRLLNKSNLVISV